MAYVGFLSLGIFEDCVAVLGFKQAENDFAKSGTTILAAALGGVTIAFTDKLWPVVKDDPNRIFMYLIGLLVAAPWFYVPEVLQPQNKKTEVSRHRRIRVRHGTDSVPRVHSAVLRSPQMTSATQEKPRVSASAPSLARATSRRDLMPEFFSVTCLLRQASFLSKFGCLAQWRAAFTAQLKCDLEWRISSIFLPAGQWGHFRTTDLGGSNGAGRFFSFAQREHAPAPSKRAEIGCSQCRRGAHDNNYVAPSARRSGAQAPAVRS